MCHRASRVIEDLSWLYLDHVWQFMRQWKYVSETGGYTIFTEGNGGRQGFHCAFGGIQGSVLCGNGVGKTTGNSTDAVLRKLEIEEQVSV